MFPYSNPEFQLDLYRQHAEELRREAAEYRLARDLRRRSRGGHRRPRAARAPVE